MLDATSLRWLLVALVGWRDQRQQDAVAYLHRERNHQGLDNALIDARPHGPTGKRIRRRSRLGGLLNYYERAA